MRKRLGLDHLGIGLSALCALHCLSIPVLFALLPSLQLALHSFNAPLRALAINLLYLQSYDRWLVALALMVAAVSLAFGWRRHRSGVPLAWMLAAAAAFATGLLLSRSQVGWHLPILLLGSSLLITAHVWNLRLLRVESRSE